MVSDFSITCDELLPLIGTAQTPRLIDVCLAQDIAADPWRLPGAQHIAHRNIMDWINISAPSEPLVIICQKGLKLSHGAAARLRAAGYDARALEGGNQAWTKANLPKLDLSNAPDCGASWVLPAPTTPHSLCIAWFIRRWFDPDAELIWVPSSMVTDVADRFDAQPAPKTLSALRARAALEYAPLAAFASSIDEGQAAWLPLLAALPLMHQSPEDQFRHALPIIDAAWVALREGAQ